MRGGILRNPRFAARLSAPHAAKSEPRLPSRRRLAANPFGRSAVANAGLSAVPGNPRTPLDSPATSAPANGPAGIPAGTLLYLGLVGFVAVAISTSFGAGFFLLATPAHGPAGISARIPDLLPPASSASAPVLPQAGIQHSPAAAAMPDASSPADISPPPSANVARAVLPAPSEAAPPAPTSSPAVPSAPASPSAAQAVPIPAAPPDSAPNSTAADEFREPVASAVSPQRPAHPRAAAPRGHYRTARDGRRPAPSQPRFPRSLTPSQAERASSFGRLLPRPAGKTAPSGDALTPPAAGTMDPFLHSALDK
jgi:hypothetical protein